MTQVIVLIIALGSIAALINRVWKRYYSKDAKIRKLVKELEQIRKQMYDALLHDGRGDKYDALRDIRGGLLKEIRDLRRR